MMDSTVDARRFSEDTEAALRGLFDQIVLFDCSTTSGDHPSNNNYNNSTKTGGDGLVFKFVPGATAGAVFVEFSDTITQWLWKLCGGEQADTLSRVRIESVICKILNEKIPKFIGPHVDLCNLRGWGPVHSPTLLLPMQNCDSSQFGLLDNMLAWLRGVVALDPGGMSITWNVLDYEVWKRCNMILRTRQILRQRTIHDHSDSGDLPFTKRQRIQRYLSGGSKDASDMGKSHMEKRNGTLNLPNRRSLRRYCLLRSSEVQLARKRIPTGQFFQTNVPEWKGSEPHKMTSDTKWLGTRMWPPEGKNMELIDKPIGIGRQNSCSCSCRMSAECVKLHVGKAKLQLFSELGLAFISMGFDKMGEEVSRSWSSEEQMKFDTSLRMDLGSHDKTCLYPPLRSFPNKSMQQVVSYYFNVHLLRWMSSNTRRRTYGEVDSDDDGRSRLA